MSRVIRAIVVLALASVGGCEFDKETVGPGARMPVVHAVISPGIGQQTILAEWLLSGRVDTASGVQQSGDPIRTGAGEPIAGATIVIIAPNGDSAIAREELDDAGASKGVYRFYNAPKPGNPAVDPMFVPLIGGERYRLRLETTEGHVVTGETVLPVAGPLRVPPPPQTLDRDLDSLYMLWDPVPEANRYLVAAESPRGQMRIFVPHNEYLLAGSVGHPGRVDVAHVFLPGFTQTVWVAAVDRNYYDYYRPTSDTTTGRGVINHLEGGIGLFGSIVLIRSYQLRIVKEQVGRLEGRWNRQQFTGNPPSTFLLYVEGTFGPTYQISGSWTGPNGPAGVYGQVENDRVTFAFLRGFTFRDTVDVFTGRWDGGRVFTGQLRSGAQVSYWMQVP